MDISEVEKDAERLEELELLSSMKSSHSGKIYREMLVKNAASSLKLLVNLSGESEINTLKIVHACASLSENMLQLSQWDNIESDRDNLYEYLKELIEVKK